MAVACVVVCVLSHWLSVVRAVLSPVASCWLKINFLFTLSRPLHCPKHLQKGFIMNLLKYSRECKRLQDLKRQCLTLGPGTPESVSVPIMAETVNCLRIIEVMEQTMFLAVTLKLKGKQ